MRKLMLAALAGTAVAALAGTAAAQQTIRIGTEGAYAPWNYIDDAGRVAGFEIELGNQICARAMLTCVWVTNNWDTIIPNLLAGNYDVIMAGMSITDERLETINFSEDYYPPDPSVFAVAGNATINFEAMTGLRIGVQSNTIQAAYAIEHYGATNTILQFETADQSIADLAAGNVQLVLADRGYLDPIVTASNGTFKIDGPPVMIGGGVGAGMRKEDTALLAAFDAAIAAMKADGSLNALITQWFEIPNTF